MRICSEKLPGVVQGPTEVLFEVKGLAHTEAAAVWGHLWQVPM